MSYFFAHNHKACHWSFNVYPTDFSVDYVRKENSSTILM